MNDPRAACQEVFLRSIAPYLYSLRHGGASEDLIFKRRTVSEVECRGHWVAGSSSNRDTKESRLQTDRNKKMHRIEVEFDRCVWAKYSQAPSQIEADADQCKFLARDEASTARDIEQLSKIRKEAEFQLRIATTLLPKLTWSKDHHGTVAKIQV